MTFPFGSLVLWRGNDFRPSTSFSLPIQYYCSYRVARETQIEMITLATLNLTSAFFFSIVVNFSSPLPTISQNHRTDLQHHYKTYSRTQGKSMKHTLYLETRKQDSRGLLLSVTLFAFTCNCFSRRHPGQGTSEKSANIYKRNLGIRTSFVFQSRILSINFMKLS